MTSQDRQRIVGYIRGDLAMFKGGGAKASPKATAKATQAKGHASSGKGSGGCGTGAGGFKAGNTCGHGGNRNATVEAARTAHTQAKNDVLAHVKAHRKATKSAAKSGESAPHPKELHAAIRKAAVAHKAFHEARDAHKAGQRDKRNAAARERRASARSGSGVSADHRSRVESLPGHLRPDKVGAMRIDHKLRNDELNNFHAENPGAKTVRIPITPALKAKAEAHLDAWSKQHSHETDKVKSILGADKLPPPIIRHYDSGTVGIPDGFHRVAAHVLAGKTHIDGYLLGHGNKPLDHVPAGLVHAPANPHTPKAPHAIPNASQSRPSTTTRPSRNDRLAVLAARHDNHARTLRAQAAESGKRTDRELAVTGKANTHIEGKAADAAYSHSTMLNGRAAHHATAANKLRDAIHDPAKSAAGARTLKSMAGDELGHPKTMARIQQLGNGLTHAELKAAATHAGLGHGATGATHKQGLVDHLRGSVGKVKEPVKAKEMSAEERRRFDERYGAEGAKESGNLQRGEYELRKNKSDKWAWHKGDKQVTGAFVDRNDAKRTFEDHGLKDSEPAKVAHEPHIKDHPEYDRLHRTYGGMSAKDRESKLDDMSKEIAGHHKAAAREFNGNGGRRSGAAVSAQAARDIGQEKLLLGLYHRHRS